MAVRTEHDEGGWLLRIFAVPVIVVIPGPDLADGGIGAGDVGDGAVAKELVANGGIMFCHIPFDIDEGEVFFVIARIAVPDITELAVHHDGADDKGDGKGKL